MNNLQDDLETILKADQELIDKLNSKLLQKQAKEIQRMAEVNS